MKKDLGITETQGAKKNIEDLVLYGKDDLFVLVSKASSKEQGWMKSTKVCNLPNGMVMQVTTQQGNNIAEALTFVPGVNYRHRNKEFTTAL